MPSRIFQRGFIAFQRGSKVFRENQGNSAEFRRMSENLRGGSGVQALVEILVTLEDSMINILRSL